MFKLNYNFKFKVLVYDFNCFKTGIKLFNVSQFYYVPPPPTCPKERGEYIVFGVDPISVRVDVAFCLYSNLDGF